MKREMKRIFTTFATLALVVSLAGTALAQRRGGRGGFENCQERSEMGQRPAPEVFQKFQNDTIDLRQEMMNKRFEVQRENLKASPDVTKIAALKAEIQELQGKISEIRVQSGLPERGKKFGECFSNGGCSKPGGNGGCNGQPCGQKF